MAVCRVLPLDARVDLGLAVTHPAASGRDLIKTPITIPWYPYACCYYQQHNQDSRDRQRLGDIVPQTIEFL